MQFDKLPCRPHMSLSASYLCPQWFYHLCALSLPQCLSNRMDPLSLKNKTVAKIPLTQQCLTTLADLPQHCRELASVTVSAVQNAA